MLINPIINQNARFFHNLYPQEKNSESIVIGNEVYILGIFCLGIMKYGQVKIDQSFLIWLLKFVFSKKATKIDEIFTVDLTLYTA